MTDQLREALFVGLAVSIHEALDPDCTGTPNYIDTSDQARSIAARVIDLPNVRAALATPELRATETPSADDTPRVTPSPDTQLREAQNIADCGKDDCTPVEHWQRVAMRAIATLVTPSPDTLDGLRAEAEAALPEGWSLLIGDERKRGKAGWWATASEPYDADKAGFTIVSSSHDSTLYDTPAAALRALAARLRSEDQG